jgi:hypothetical protein
MAVFNWFNAFTKDLGTKIHNLSGDTLKVMLTNTAPVATNTSTANITEITAGNGYVTGGKALNSQSFFSTGGKSTLTAASLVFAASGGSVGPFRYAVLYNSTAGGNLIGWYDYGSSLTLATSQILTITWDASGIINLNPPDAYVLDKISATSAAAYSTRKLRAAYNGSAIRVRRSADSVELDIGFDSAGNLDEATLTSFATGSTDAFITTWYDQSGNGRSLLQATALAQPPIIWSGTFQRFNTKPAIRFQNTNGFYMRASGFTAAQPWTRSSVIQFMDVTNTTNRVFLDNANSALAGSLYTPTTFSVDMFRGSGFTINSTVVENTQAAIIELANGASSKGVFNGTSTTGNPSTNGMDGLTVGCKRDTSLYAQGYIPEVILFGSSVTDPDIATIQADQKAFWGTP